MSGPVLGSLRQFWRGLLTVHYGSCAGDPIAWERDMKRRRLEEAEAEQAEAKARAHASCVTPDPLPDGRDLVAAD
ncbi:MAG TPA: hypothetical protein VJP86_12435 [Vicinamibacterales bacterium]|jgi:hypothetical protein|nr:hypothetical protein [Vicinamibacterales bacterium]